MNKPLKWLQGWTAQSEADQHHSDIYVMTGQKDSKEAAETRTTKIISINLHCMCDHIDNMGPKSDS